MNKKSITSEDFDKGIELFLKILAAQPGMFRADQGVGTANGQQLADMAGHFSLSYNKFKAMHGVD